MTGEEVDKGTIPDRGLLGWDPRAGWSLGHGQSGKELQAEVNTHTQHTAARGWEQGAGQVAMEEQVAKRMPTQAAQSWLEELVYQEGTETVRAGGGQ